MFPSPSLPAGFELSPRPSLPAGDGAVYAAESACGQGLRTGAHLRCFPSHRCAAGPVSRSHGRLRRPKSLPIRHSPAAAQCSSHWAGGIASVLTSWLHRFASLGLKSRIDARIAPDLTFWLHRFAILGLKSGITAAPSCRRVEWPAFGRSLPPRCRVRFQFSSSESRTVPPA